ncbi:MAG: AI-2E family transporter [Eubacterium sp.]|nr:AI-2E family transporter [Eubacterium sp.]
MLPKTKQNLIVVIVGVSLFAALMNLSAVLNFCGKVASVILPVIVGGILAFFFNVPVNGAEKILKRIFNKRKNKPSDKLIHILSFVLTLIFIFLVLFAVLTLLVPEIMRSLQRLDKQLEISIPKWIAYLNGVDNNSEFFEELFSIIDLEKIMQGFSNAADVIFANIADALSTAVSTVVTAAFAVIISIYMILGKDGLCRHARKLVCAYLKPVWSENLFRFCRMFCKSFSSFLTGQCSEAVILGTLMFAAFTFFKLPYGSLVGVLTAVCAIIPYVGAFISCSVSVILTLLIDPALAIRCLAVYLIVQFVENQFIYPRVVGNSVGLPPLYTLIAAMIGGKLFGIIGIIFFIPLTAVIIELIKTNAKIRLHKNKNTLHTTE